MGVIRLPEYRAPPPGRRCTPHSSFCRPCRRPAKSKRLLRNLAIPSCVRVSGAVRIIPVRLQCCSGVAMVLFPWVSLGYPLYIPCTSLVHPLYTRGDFGSRTVSRRRCGLGLTALVWLIFKCVSRLTFHY